MATTTTTKGRASKAGDPTALQQRQQDKAGEAKELPSVLFDASKKESHTPQAGFKKLYRKLRATHKITLNNSVITFELLKPHTIVVFGCPRDKFSADEFEAIRRYVREGGNILVLGADGGERASGSNVNTLLEEFGVSLNSDSVVRSCYLKYSHPKEVLIANGVINREINAVAGKREAAPKSKQAQQSSLTIVYPFGVTLNVHKPAVPVLTTSYIAYPMNRPICAFFTVPQSAQQQQQQKSGKGKEKQQTSAAMSTGSVVVLGSVHMFSDEWLDKEENEKLQEVIWRYLTPSQRFPLNEIDANVPEVSEYHHIPDTEALSERWRTCLQDTDDAPSDFTEMFDDTPYRLDMSLLPETVDLYAKLTVPHEPLALIPPQFEAPLPPLQPAVFPPVGPELPPPMLDLFDLDTEFATEKVRLAHQALLCSGDENSLQFFVQACGEIVGITPQLKDEDKRNAKQILAFALKQLVGWRRINVHEAEARQ